MIDQIASPARLAARVAGDDVAGLASPDFDAAEWLADPANFALTDGANVMMFTELPGKIFDGHWLLVDRGRQAFLTATLFLRHVFVLHEAEQIVGLVPAHRRAARWFTKQMGFISHGLQDTEQGPQEYFTLTRQQFEARYGFFEI